MRRVNGEICHSSVDDVWLSSHPDFLGKPLDLFIFVSWVWCLVRALKVHTIPTISAQVSVCIGNQGRLGGSLLIKLLKFTKFRQFFLCRQFHCPTHIYSHSWFKTLNIEE